MSPVDREHRVDFEFAGFEPSDRVPAPEHQQDTRIEGIAWGGARYWYFSTNPLDAQPGPNTRPATLVVHGFNPAHPARGGEATESGGAGSVLSQPRRDVAVPAPELTGEQLGQRGPNRERPEKGAETVGSSFGAEAAPRPLALPFEEWANHVPARTPAPVSQPTSEDHGQEQNEREIREAVAALMYDSDRASTASPAHQDHQAEPVMRTTRKDLDEALNGRVRAPLIRVFLPGCGGFDDPEYQGDVDLYEHPPQVAHQDHEKLAQELEADAHRLCTSMDVEHEQLMVVARRIRLAAAALRAGAPGKPTVWMVVHPSLRRSVHLTAGEAYDCAHGSIPPGRIVPLYAARDMEEK